MSPSSGFSRTQGSDEVRVRRAALGVGAVVGIASVAIVAVVAAVAVALLIGTSRAEGRPDRSDRHGQRVPWQERVIDVDDALPVILLLCALAIVVLTLVAWYAARRATAPLGTALRVQRAFVADASHELRTPLTTLSSRLQLAQRRAARGEDVTRDLERARQDAEVLSGVLTDLLVAAESAGVAPAGDARAEVDSVAEDAVAIIGPRASERGVEVRLDLEPHLAVAADPTAVTRALVALLDNSVRHTASGNGVRIEARRAGSDVHLRVQDEGCGIDAQDPEELFGRFVRRDSGEGRRGFGLGLALVRDVADRFGGTVRVEETSSAGTTMLITLPAR